MNNMTNGQIDTEIKIKEFGWDLLEQWKAVLITAVVMMVLVAGAKYVKDIKEYKTAQAEKEAERKVTASVGERIESVLDSLPENERSTVMTIVNQNDWIESQKEYINDSILINADPTRQRTLCADYYIDAGGFDETVGPSLIKAYAAYLRSGPVVKCIGDAIDPGIEKEYIAELISTNNDRELAAAETSDSVLEVCIALPDYADADKVEEALTAAVVDYSAEMSERISPHSISKIYSGEKYLYNESAVNKRTNTLYSINTLQNNTKAMQSGLTDEQRSAVEAITEIKAAESTDGSAGAGTETAPVKEKRPRVSEKYALLGLILGVMAYAFAYLVIILLRGRLMCAADVSSYTGTRLLGELYEAKEKTGLMKMFTSRTIKKIRYGDRLDSRKQTEKMKNSIEALCRHEGIKELTLIDLTGSDRAIEKVSDAIRRPGLKLSEIKGGSEINENDLCDKRNTVIVADDGTGITVLRRLMELLKDYDIEALGSIYTAEI